MNRFYVSAALGLALAISFPAQATSIYTTADFSGGIFTVTSAGSGLGLQRTNTCSGCAAGNVSGHLLFDQGLTPGAGSGYVNVPLATVSGASNSVIFDAVIGSNPLGFDFGDSNNVGGPSIQFKNGVFNGFFLVDDFVFNNKSYELSIQGGTWTINSQKDGFYSELAASGYINIGAGGLTHQAVYDPAPPQLPVTTIPEPTTVALILFGIWGIFMNRQRGQARITTQAAAC